MYINSRSSKVLHEILSGRVFKSIPKVLFFQYLSFKETCKPNIRFVYIFFPKFCACMLSRPTFHLDHTPPDQNFNDQLEAQLTRRCFETVSKRGRSFISMTHVQKRMTHRIKSDRKQISYKIEKKKSIRQHRLVKIYS